MKPNFALNFTDDSIALLQGRERVLIAAELGRINDALDTLLPLYINFQVYQMLVESRASEHSARMVAMKGATDNAKKFIKELTLEYNKLRQAAITAELLEITTAMKAME